MQNYTKSYKFTVMVALGVIILFGLGWGAWYTMSNPQKESGNIKIGVITPLTGPAAEYGLATKNGLDLAMEQINQAGGIKSRSIELVYQDDKCDPTEGLNALQQMNSVGGVKIVVGTICSSVALAMGPVAEEKNILIISSGASNPKISDYSNIFRTWPSDASQGIFVANFIANELKMTRAAVIYINNDYGSGLKDSFERIFVKNRGTIVGEESIPEGATDVRVQIMKLKALEPQVVFIASYGQEMGVVLKQAKELGLSAQFMGGEGTEDPKIIQAAGLGAEGLIGTKPATLSSPIRDAFVKAFKSKYNENIGISSDSAYDILFILKESMGKCAEVDNVDCVKKGLLSLHNFPGAIGNITFDKNGDLANVNYDLVQVKNGQFVPYRE